MESTYKFKHHPTWEASFSNIDASFYDQWQFPHYLGMLYAPEYFINPKKDAAFWAQ